MNSNELRRTFTDYFVARGHTPVPSASLIPADSTLLFTVAGMVPFKPYFLGEEPAPFPRATSIQKCVRAGGKHNDLDQIGRTLRHLTFFEMLGNFSFGDYFKESAIPYAWGLVTEALGLDPERLWITVHVSDDEAAALWRESVGVPAERIQRLDEDNWWQMGETGPCGPCSEIYFDKGERYGNPGGPAHGGDERYLEIWNLVFMQYDRQPDGSLVPLPRPCIDTGAGLERIIPVLQGQPSVYETDVVAPILEEAQSLTGRVYGRNEDADVGLRIISDHARSMTFLLADGVVPTNEGRGYVLRRIMRRLMLRAHLLGAKGRITPRLVAQVVETMGGSYPELVERERLVVDLAAREEERFFATLELGLPLLEDAIREGAVRGETAFRLHDTFGVPIELTTELAADRGVSVDLAGFDEAMADQRRRSRAGGLGLEEQAHGSEAALRVLEAHGKTEFVGYETFRAEATVLAVEEEAGARTVYLDCTPFYPEGGGQVGDTGWLRAPGVEVAIKKDGKKKKKK
jgi:alanyl-tRNA synthetase